MCRESVKRSWVGLTGKQQKKKRHVHILRHSGLTFNAFTTCRKIHSLTVYGGCCKFYSKKGCDDQSLNIATVKSMPKGITSKSWLTSQEDLLEKISAFKCVKDVTCNGL